MSQWACTANRTHRPLEHKMRTSNMIRLRAAALAYSVLSVAGISAPFAAAAEPVEITSQLVSECKQEALRGHRKGLSVGNAREHKAHMTAICDGWLSIGDRDRSELLSRCLAESQHGPFNRRRGINWDRAHVLRHEDICRRLGAANTPG